MVPCLNDLFNALQSRFSCAVGTTKPYQRHIDDRQKPQTQFLIQKTQRVNWRYSKLRPSRRPLIVGETESMGDAMPVRGTSLSLSLFFFAPAFFTISRLPSGHWPMLSAKHNADLKKKKKIRDQDPACLIAISGSRLTVGPQLCGTSSASPCLGRMTKSSSALATTTTTTTKTYSPPYIQSIQACQKLRSAASK
jgi:hypothetical protein